ncbi:ABC-2 type transport system ATP-binding protein [Paenibacillus sp. UNCCL117]|uniref:ABC transporter ATP-binding protein n=1 Tax=unclassified Paenibacillus TaxID=185978 RepID=UPI00087F7CBA|nr:MULTISPECIES: ATP-binding cassette domain-containing protein [unclassified Paenibacillus]SDE29320.1 ABC-2 type transport system ATP-binding protein [Paenibacillus sp. cl123]SFW63298.1 ABC-2 type transport system ATP-binding protein [Paenibacillus sp. UNCCL117]
MTAIRIERLNKTFEVKKKQPGLAGSLRSLWKPVYEQKQAVSGISFSVQQGEMLAFLGPNGAGKSTTIKMLTGILHPTSGQAEVLGCNPWKERNKLAYRIGSVFGQKSQLWYHLPPADTFELMRHMYELPRGDYLARKEELVRRFELEPYWNTPVRKLSLGERMRCEIAVSLLHRPRIVFLDEPTIGLDVVVKLNIRELIRDMNREEGMTVFLTSHDAGDVEQLCERAIVVNHGRMILDDKVASMKRELLTYKTIRLIMADEHGLAAVNIPGAEVKAHEGVKVTLSVNTSRIPIEAVLARLVGQVRIRDVTIEDPPMEEVITHIYAQAGADASEGQGGEPA